MTDLRALVAQDTLATYSEGDFADLKASKRGDLIVIDWYKQMAMEGRVYQVKAGTITTPLIGDAPLTNSQAEFCVDAGAAALTVIPVYLNIGIRLGTGTLHEYAAKSVATASTAGTAFIPLPLLIGATASTATARVAAHAVTVTAEAATTTRRHWAYSNPLAVAAGSSTTGLEWTPRCPPVLPGPACFYVQIAATGTGPSYYAHLDFIEMATASIS